MASVHVLAQDLGRRKITLVLHVAVPAGNNSAGFTWKDASVNSSLNRTILATGTGAGQITSAEATQVTSGDVWEFITEGDVDGDPTLAQLQAIVALRSAEGIAQRKAALKWFGFTN